MVMRTSSSVMSSSPLALTPINVRTSLVEPFSNQTSGVAILPISFIAGAMREATASGRAMAISAVVKLRRANPDGRDSGVLVFSLVRSGAKWLVKDIDFRTEESTRGQLAGFRKKNPDAKEVQ